MNNMKQDALQTMTHRTPGRSARLTVVRLSVSGILLLGLLGLTACSPLQPSQPALETMPEKTEWQGAEGLARSSADIDPQWWAGFGDETLNQLVDSALMANSDLRIAMARLDEAGAAIGQVEAARLPSLNAGLSTPVRAARNPMTQNVETTRSYQAQTELSWEIDLWGKLKEGVKAKESAYEASAADWRATHLNTAASVASSYFLIRQFDEQIQMQQQALEDARQILQIYQFQYQEGLLSSKEVSRQQAELNSLQRSLIDLQRERQVTENALATLLGKPAGTFSLPADTLDQAVQDMPVPGGLPAELLRRRPDILAAEYRVLEAHQLLGQARLAQLPSISLTANAQGGGDLASATLNQLVQSATYGLTPSISIPLFDPDTQARIDSSRASAVTAEEQYRKSVLQAFREVEDALVNLSARRAQRAQLEEEASHLEIVAEQVRAQLREGIATQLEVFESERRLLDVRQSLLRNRQQILSDTITLYKAMGGGWPLEPAIRDEAHS